MREPRDNSHILVGLALIVVGFGFFINETGVLQLTISARLWPLILLFLGLVKFLAPRRGRSRRGGIWLLSIGVWGLISEFRLFGLDYDTSWPLLIVALGAAMVWRSIDESSAPPQVKES